MGTKGTLIMTRELEAYLFNEGEGSDQIRELKFRANRLGSSR